MRKRRNVKRPLGGGSDGQLLKLPVWEAPWRLGLLSYVGGPGEGKGAGLAQAPGRPRQAPPGLPYAGPGALACTENYDRSFLFGLLIAETQIAFYWNFNFHMLQENL